VAAYHGWISELVGHAGLQSMLDGWLAGLAMLAMLAG